VSLFEHATINHVVNPGCPIVTNPQVTILMGEKIQPCPVMAVLYGSQGCPQAIHISTSHAACRSIDTAPQRKARRWPGPSRSGGGNDSQGFSLPNAKVDIVQFQSFKPKILHPILGVLTKKISDHLLHRCCKPHADL